MARRIENADGMFPIERIEPRDITPAEWQAAADRANEQLDLVKRLAAIELDAKARARSSNDTIRNYAEAVLAYIWGIRQFIEKGGEVGTVLAYALSVGQLDERMGEIERNEEDVSCGRGHRRRGREHAATVAESRRERRMEIQACVKEHIRKRGRHKTPSDTAIYQKTAAAFGVSTPTVRRACGKK